MATNTTKPARESLQSQYARQFTDHLEANRSEQADLRARLEQLKTDETWLVQALQTLSTAGRGLDAQAATDVSVHSQSGVTEPVQPTPNSGTAPSGDVPAQQRDKSIKAPVESVDKKTTTKNSSAQTARTRSAAAPVGGPSLGELLLTVLSKHPGQPRTANEVASELERAYPERARNTTIVRNTLERLVAKSRVERRKQKHNVLYTLTDSHHEADRGAPELGSIAKTAEVTHSADADKPLAQV
ncbi:hypothetical protein ACIRP3_42250 [Streptomyces sp. NPDC101209]|uniref:hypothetical protein n=1 Tax=Streptomyces sp. NPDC101209 TaxID=3366129 RepID=UPI00382A124E